MAPGRDRLSDAPPLSWSAALAEGQARLQRPDPLGALPYLLHAASPEAPHNEQADAHAALGRIRTGLGQDSLAAEHYRAVLALRPTQPEARFLLGRALLKLGWPDLAVATLARLPGPIGGWWRDLVRQAGRRLSEARNQARQGIAVLRQGDAAGSPDTLVRALLRAGRLGPAQRLLAALPPTPERRWLAAALLLRRREGFADQALRAALRPPPGASPALRQEAALRLIELGETDAAAAALGDAVGGRLGQELQAKLLLLQGRLPELAALSSVELARKPDRTEPARRLLTCQVLAGEVPVWREPDPRAGAAPRLSLVQFWHDANPPEDVRGVMDSWVHHHPDLELARFDTQTARDFILAHQGQKVALAYDACHNPALRSDMLRLSFLAAQGGLWVDADERCLRPMYEVLARLPGIGLVAPFSDELPFYVHSYMLAAPPGSPVMAALLEAQMRLLREVLRGRAGLENWVSNGPGLITRIAARMPGQVALLAPAYWRSFAGDADDLAYKRDESSDWRLAPRARSAR